MMTNTNALLVLAISLTLLSCGTTRNISSGQLSKSDRYKRNSYSGCCGCWAEYFNIYTRGEKQEQIIYKYTCYSPGMPTKFIFNYDENGSLLYCDKFVATTANDFESPLTDNEKYLFALLDRDKAGAIGDSTFKFSEIKGFRKANDAEITHKFPLIPGGVKAAVK